MPSCNPSKALEHRFLSRAKHHSETCNQVMTLLQQHDGMNPAEVVSLTAFHPHLHCHSLLVAAPYFLKLVQSTMPTSFFVIGGWSTIMTIAFPWMLRSTSASSRGVESLPLQCISLPIT